MTNATGVDVSHYEYVTDWDKLLASGCSFIGAKATQGLTNVDAKLISHRDGARARPELAMVIYYHYPSGGDPVAEADHFVSTIGELRDNERYCLDVEEGKSGTDAPLIDWQKKFIGRLPQDRKRIPLIYTARHVWAQIGDPDWPDATVGKVDLWAKRYATAEPSVPPPWSFWRFWQQSEDAIVPGVSGPCDFDVFNGDVAQLRSYAQLASV